jgi:hypothetical protein
MFTTTTADLAAFQRKASKDETMLTTRYGRKGAATATRPGGGEVRNLVLWMHAETGGACLYCGGETNVYGETSHPDTATLATLIPCALIDEDNGIRRMGYVPGNVALAHSGCVAASNAFGLATGEPVVITADSVNAALVPMAWPKARKSRSAAADPDAAMALQVARARAGWPF